MSEWSDRLSSSPVWAALNDLGPALDHAHTREGNEPPSIQAIARLQAALAFIGKRLSAADAFLVQPGPIDNVSSQVQAAVAEVQQFVANGSIGHLTNANSHIDNALTHLSQINFPSGVNDIQGLREAADKYRKALNDNSKQAHSAVAAVAKQTEELAAKLTDLSVEMAAERQRLSSLTSDFQSQFSTAQETRSSDFTSGQTSRQEKFAEWIAQITEALTKQEAAFTKDRERITTEHSAAITGLNSQFQDSAKKILDDMKRHRADVEKLVGVIGNLGVTSGYVKTANEAKVTARVWQAIAVGAMLALIAVGYFVFLPVVQGGFSWEAFAGRVFFTLTIGVLAAYAAHQADRFMAMEKRNRILALELEALGPYLAPLPEAEQQKFRIAIGDRTFGQEIASLTPEGKSPASVIDLAFKSKDLKSLIVEIVKAARG